MKKHLKTILFFAVLLLCLNLSLTVYGAEKNTSFENTKITARTGVWNRISAGLAGSAAVAIMDNGKLVYTEYFGMADREQSIPVDQDTVFNIGSISKMYVTTAILMLVDEDKVDLDKPVTTYLPEFTMADQCYKDIKVRMLLNHSSGLPGTTAEGYDGYEYNRNYYSELLDTLAKSNLKHKPGEFAPYCNDGFTLAEMIVAKVSCQSYADFLKERIFKPLNLTHTGIGVGRIKSQEGLVPARYYRPDGKVEPIEVTSSLGAGGLSSSVADLCKFGDSFCVGGKPLLSEKSLQEIFQPQPNKLHITNAFCNGLGWDLAELTPFPEKNIRIFGKGGNVKQFSSELFTLPSQRISVAVTTTNTFSNQVVLAFDILRVYLEEKGLIAKKPAQPVTMPVKAQPVPAGLMTYEGYYFGDAGLVRIALDKDKGTLTEYGVMGEDESVIFEAVYNNGYFYDGNTKYFFTTTEGTNYLAYHSDDMDLTRLSLEKLQPPVKPLQLAVPMDGKVWLQRNVKAYEEWINGHLLTSRQISKLPGYVDFGLLEIVTSPDSAGMPVKTVMNLCDLKLFKKDDSTWAWLSGAVYMPAELVAALKDGVNTLTIGKDGYNEWLKVGADAVLHFTAPAKGRIIVFDAANTPFYDNYIDSGDCFAPAGSYIEVAGNPGDEFKVTATVADQHQ